MILTYLSQSALISESLLKIAIHRNHDTHDSKSTDNSNVIRRYDRSLIEDGG